MKNMNTCKRVSFGSKGSMVETLIIEDIPYVAEENVYADNINNNKSAEDTLNAKPPDEKKHVTIVLTDAEEDSTSSSVDKQIHPDPNKTGQQSEEEGSWPLKRSQSVNSRDNPFLPGGNLSKEADEILSKATIIRDTFILTEEQNRAKKLNSQNPTRSGSNHSSANQSPVQETVTEQKVVPNSECIPEQNESPARTRPKENGQLDGDNSLTPGSVTVELIDDNKDRKKQKKCCVIM